MELDLKRWCQRKISCSCGQEHYCPIASVEIGEGVLLRLPQKLSPYRHILLASDTNTHRACGERVYGMLRGQVQRYLVFERQGNLVPDERAVSELEAALTEETDLIVGVGSGVINDLCKYVSWKRGLQYVIVATAPSMDGYASSGAAMITDGMKVTYTTHPPMMIFGDTDVLRHAPEDMIRSGYGDIIGKYSSLNDWQLSHVLNGEHLCREIYDLVLAVTDGIRDAAEPIMRREAGAVEMLTGALVLIGITLSLLDTTRPGSGSEHHLSHFFEITGLVHRRPHFPHGTDVAYAAVLTARMREEICAAGDPVFCPESTDQREAAWQRIYGPLVPEVRELQRSAGWYDRDMQAVYREKWQDVRRILGACPSAEEMRGMLLRAGFDPEGQERMYGREKIRDAMFYGKDLKNRFTMLWIYYSLFSGRQG